ncbi:MAG TPA: site-specific integrase, partial [Luteibacter sp.]|nr:site-specific integrase [Luteibacter sp.]
MGSILARRRKDGTTAYTAQIRLKRDGVIYFSQAETFDRRALATEWMRRREAELDQRRARGEPLGKRHTLGDLVTWYREEVGPTAEWGRTKEADLLRLANYAIAKKAAVDLTVADFIDHAHVRRA